MNISNTNAVNNVLQSGSGSNSSSTSTTGNSTLTKNDFLQLLVAQMKNQNPSNPLNSTQFATQLAQFNSVEQLINLNSGLQSLENSQNTMSAGLNNTLAASLVGKSVKAMSNSVYSTAGQPTDIQFNLAQPATNVTVKIQDASGNTVRTEQLSNLNNGDNEWVWNGRDNNGNTVPTGNYTVQVSAKSGSSSVNAYNFVTGNATKVKYSGKGVELKVDNTYVKLGNVLEIGKGIS